MHDISPVLSGRYDAAAIGPTPVNFTVSGNMQAAGPTDVQGTPDASAANAVDQRRYTKFDRTASNAGTDTNFSFGDFLDMINPLQHIPVASSIYREAAGEAINPVARVAGDVIYGGIFGVVSAAISGLGAVSDSVMEAQTGKDTAGYVMASLLGGDETKAANPSMQAAAATATSVPAQTAGVLAPAASSTPAQPQAAPQIAAANSVPPDSTPHLAALENPGNPGSAKFFPLNQNKLPYGGVMAPPVGNMQQQNMIMALSQASHSMRLGNTIYTGKFMNGPHPLPGASNTDSSASVSAAATTVAPAPAAQAPATPQSPVAPMTGADMAAATGDNKTGPQRNPIPQNLVDDMLMLKGLNQYNNLATGAPATGSKLDITN